MEEEEKERLEPIPKDFYSFETGAPFTECLECGSNLMNGQPYLIEKAFKNHLEFKVKDTVFDYALCLNCAERLRNEMSKESMDALMKFFGERINIEQQMARLHASAEENLSSCMVTGKPVDECYEYQIYAYCMDGNLSNEMPPYMINGEVMDEILPILSEKTKDDLNGFFNKHFSPDPSIMEPLGPKLVLI